MADLCWQSGINFAIDAICQLKRQGMKISYKIVGSGTALEELGLMCHRFGLESEIEIFLDWQGENEELYNWCDFFLYVPVVDTRFSIEDAHFPERKLRMIFSEKVKFSDQAGTENVRIVASRSSRDIVEEIFSFID